MNEEQENIIRCIFSNLRKVRLEIDELYQKKKRLEYLSDHFYVSYLDDLWIKTNIQLGEVYNIILDRFAALNKLQTIILRATLGENINPNDITPFVPKK